MGSKHGPTRTIMVVEDNAEVRLVMARILELSGYRVLTATDGAAALEEIERLGEEQIDLLLTDVVMPGLHGPALVERLRERRWSQPVLYVTGWSDSMLSSQGLHTEGTPMLRKPFSQDQLLRQVYSVLRPADPGDGWGAAMRSA